MTRLYSIWPRSQSQGGYAGRVTSNELTMDPDLPTVGCVLVSWKAILLYKKSGSSSTLRNSCQNQEQINQHIFIEHLPCAYLNGSQPWLFTDKGVPRYNLFFDGKF